MKKSSIFTLVLILMFFLTGCSIKKVQELTDAEKFAKEFNISKENPFVYTTIDHIINIFENNGKAIIFFANSDDEGSIQAATYITNLSKTLGIKKIYYYNPKKLEDKNPKKYKKLLSYMENSLEDDELLLPTLCSLVNGKIINYSNSFSNEDELSEEYLTKKIIKQIKNKYEEILTYQEEKVSD